MYADHDQNHLPHREHSISHANDDVVKFPGLLPPFCILEVIKKTNWRCRRRGNENRGCILNCFVISLPCFPTFCNSALPEPHYIFNFFLLLVVFLKVTIQCSSQDLPSYVNAMEGTNCELHAINELDVLIIYKHHHFSSYVIDAFYTRPLPQHHLSCFQ